MLIHCFSLRVTESHLQVFDGLMMVESELGGYKYTLILFGENRYYLFVTIVMERY